MNMHVITGYYNPLSCNWSLHYYNLNTIKTFHSNVKLKKMFAHSFHAQLGPFFPMRIALFSHIYIYIFLRPSKPNKQCKKTCCKVVTKVQLLFLFFSFFIRECFAACKLVVSPSREASFCVVAEVERVLQSVGCIWSRVCTWLYNYFRYGATQAYEKKRIDILHSIFIQIQFNKVNVSQAPRK